MLSIWVSHYVFYYHQSQIIPPLRSFSQISDLLFYMSDTEFTISIPDLDYVLPHLSLLILSLTLWVRKPPSLCLFSYHIYISASVFCRFYFRKASWVSCVCFMPTGIALVQLLINSHLEKSLIYSKKYLLSSYYVPVNILVTEAVLMNPINIKPMIYW